MNTTVSFGKIKRINEVTEFQRSCKDWSTSPRRLGWKVWLVWRDTDPDASKAVQVYTSVRCKSAQWLRRVIDSTSCRRREIRYPRHATVIGRRTTSHPKSGMSLSGRDVPTLVLVPITKRRRSNCLSRKSRSWRSQVLWPFWCRSTRGSSCQGVSQIFLPTTTSIRPWAWPGQPGMRTHRRRGHQRCQQPALV